MNILVTGSGESACELAGALDEVGLSVAAIVRDAEDARRLEPLLEDRVSVDNATDPTTFGAFEGPPPDLVVCAFEDDPDNLVGCLLAQEVLQCDTTVSMLRSPSNTPHFEKQGIIVVHSTAQLLDLCQTHAVAGG